MAQAETDSIIWNGTARNPVALVVFAWEHDGKPCGATIAYRDSDGHLYGCRQIRFGVDFEACLNAWGKHACDRGLVREDRRGWPKFSDWLKAKLGVANWCLATRRTPYLLARYGHVITRKQYARLESEFAAMYGTANGIMGIG